MKKLIYPILAVFLLASAQLEAGDKGPKFEDNYDKALKLAEKEKKPVILVFSASWCPPCQKMKKDVYPSAEVAGFHDKFIWAYLDTDKKANSKPAGKYGVSGIPHIEIQSPDGKQLKKVVGGRSPADFAKILQEALDKS